MATSRSSTPAAKRRSATRKASRGTSRRGHSSSGQRPKAAPKRAAAKRTPARRAPARTASAKRARSRPAATGIRIPSLRTALLLACIVAVALIGGYFAWLRNSSLVAVTEVEVGGLSSPDAPRIEQALTEAATEMTTLNVDEARLDRAVAGFPTVVSVSADPDLLHGLAISVNERPPALIAKAKKDEVPVSADGTLLLGLELGDQADQLPVLAVDALPTAGRLEGEALQQAIVLGGAPAPLRPLIEGVAIVRGSGVEVTMRGDIPIRFGGSEDAGAKWAAAAAVLADPKLKALTYVDVRVPDRPAVGGAATQPIADPAADPALSAPVEPAVAEEPVATPAPVEPAL